MNLCFIWIYELNLWMKWGNLSSYITYSLCIMSFLSFIHKLSKFQYKKIMFYELFLLFFLPFHNILTLDSIFLTNLNIKYQKRFELFSNWAYIFCNTNINVMKCLGVWFLWISIKKNSTHGDLTALYQII